MMAIPVRMRELAMRGILPVPFFVATINGIPDFRVVDHEKIGTCIARRLCWICGHALESVLTFASGPIMTLTRVAPEPPCHFDCAEYAAVTWPYMLNPSAQRRPVGNPSFAGNHDLQNPGVWALWTTTGARPFAVPNGVFFRLDDAVTVHWFTRGRRATEQEVRAALQKYAHRLERMKMEAA